MKIPGARRAHVDPEKITTYLLDGSHPDSGGKASFFRAMGFDVAEWELFAKALQAHAVAADVAGIVESRHGTKYLVEGDLEGPTGHSARVRTVWIAEQDRSPRLVTAYPAGKGGSE